MLAFLLAVAISIPATDATVGYSAIDLETGRTMSQNGSDHFPMASVFKFPVAIDPQWKTRQRCFGSGQAVAKRGCALLIRIT